MSYQNLDSEILLALAIWLLAIGIFIIMLLMAFLEIMAEHRAKMHINPKPASNRWENLRHIAVSMFQRRK